ncbi:MAG: hypothetical protein LBT46_03735 [Planctomycetaceae bacterium]|jgi:hypothetical protein|nr:hypothetical protein [Planctomycetaceae bacterium]
MSFNFFDWVRNGVKDSVLLGVSDAVNRMGMPQEESSKDKILSFLQSPSPTEENAVPNRRIGTPATGSRKLGRSLSDLQITKEAS